jgi:hypothetical protein
MVIKKKRRERKERQINTEHLEHLEHLQMEIHQEIPEKKNKKFLRSKIYTLGLKNKG